MLPMLIELRLVLPSARAPLLPDGVIADGLGRHYGIPETFDRPDLVEPAISYGRSLADPAIDEADYRATILWGMVRNGHELRALVSAIYKLLIEVRYEKNRYPAQQKLTTAYELTGTAIEMLVLLLDRKDAA